MRQQVAELPDVNWKCYMDSVEKIVRQHSSVYQRTRRKGSGKEAATLTKMVTQAFSFTLSPNTQCFNNPHKCTTVNLLCKTILHSFQKRFFSYIGVECECQA